eukprot:COSAG05_NODE_267_length_12595_cov_7.076905_4_plen_43_part_00
MWVYITALLTVRYFIFDEYGTIYGSESERLKRMLLVIDLLIC